MQNKVMNKKEEDEMKKLISVLMMVMVLLNCGVVQAKPFIYLNGERANLSKSPLIVNGRTYLPLRATGEALGAIVDWKGETKTITISRSYKKVVLRIGEKTARVNNEIVNLDAPAFVKDSVTYVPVRFVADCLGIQVDYYSTSQIVSLITDSTKAASIQAELSEVKEVITPIEELTPSNVRDYGNAFIGGNAVNVYTGKQLEQIYIVSRSQLPIKMGTQIIHDVWMTKDGNIMAKLNRDGRTEALPLYISDNDGFKRYRGAWKKPTIDSNGIMTVLYNQHGLEDWGIMGENYPNHTFKDLKYVVYNWAGQMLAIPRKELLQ